MSAKEKVLVVDDEPSIRKYLQTLLEVDGFDVEAISSGKEAIAKVNAGERPDFIILDVLMPEMNGLDALEGIDAVGSQPQRDHAQLLKRSDGGRSDSLRCARLPDQAVRKNRTRRGDAEIAAEKTAHPGKSGSARLLRSGYRRPQLPGRQPANGADPPANSADRSRGCACVHLWRKRRGKEVVSRMIHLRSKRRNQPFIKVNCAALPGELLESELFGFEQGAFTGAVRAKPGKFELANKGTIFLDEIAEMSTHLQAKLLHVLQDHQYSRLGGRHMVETDVRVLAATNVDVQEAMKSGRFREDLYYRLNVLSILVPPLRERTAEIPLLFRHFLEKYSEKFGKPLLAPSKYLLDAALNYPWPGNLRELENFVKRYVILEDDEGSLRELIEMSSARQRRALRRARNPFCPASKA